MFRVGGIIMALAIATSGDFPDPSKLPAKPELPDPLVMFNGKAVATKEKWFSERRPELKKLYEHYMFGIAPPAPKVHAKVERVDRQALGGKATLKEITLTLGDFPNAEDSSAARHPQQATSRPRSSSA